MRILLITILISGCSTHVVLGNDATAPDAHAQTLGDGGMVEHRTTCETLCAAGAVGEFCSDGGEPNGALCVETCALYQARALNTHCELPFQALIECLEAEGDGCAESCEPARAEWAACYLRGA